MTSSPRPTIQCPRCRVPVPIAALGIKDRCHDRCPLPAQAPVTRDTLQGAKMRRVLHADGTGFYQNHYRCDEHPRLLVIDTGPRGRGAKNVQYGRRFYVDGEECVDIDAVAAALNTQPKEARTA